MLSPIELLLNNAAAPPPHSSVFSLSLSPHVPLHRSAGAPSLRTRGVVCPKLNVLGATYANCDGVYEFAPGQEVEWAPDRPVYKHRTKDR